jgi:hypothetical protein
VLLLLLLLLQVVPPPVPTALNTYLSGKVAAGTITFTVKP